MAHAEIKSADGTQFVVLHNNRQIHGIYSHEGALDLYVQVRNQKFVTGCTCDECNSARIKFSKKRQEVGA